MSIDGIEKERGLLGGLNRPMVDVVNLDSDEDLELVVFDIDGSVVLTFDRIADEWSLNKSLSQGFPELYDWVFFRDYNNDGITDIFTQGGGQFTFGIQVYEGFLDGDVLHFNLVELEDDDKNLLFYFDSFLNKRYLPVTPTNLPAIEDFDGDGDLDVLTFNAGGFFGEFYENRSFEDGLDPSTWPMEQGSACWGNFFETGNADGVLLNEPCEGQDLPLNGFELKAHGSAALTAFDRDADGDLDVLLSDVTREGIVYLENGGTPEYGDVVSQETDFPAESVAADIPLMPYPSFADINLDGREDMIVSPAFFSSENVEVCWYYENNGSADPFEFELIEKEWLVKDMVDLGKGSDPCFVDYDQDGLLDLVVGTTGFFVPEGGTEPHLFLFLNTGSSTNPAYELVDDDLFGFSAFGNDSWGFSPAFGDLDADGDLDCLIGDFNGALHFLENNAGPNQPLTFEPGVYPYMGIDTTVSIGQNATPIIYDLNQDGLGDILMGNDRGQIRYFENQGTGNEAFFDPDPSIAPNVEFWGDVSLQIPGVEKSYSSPVLVSDNEGLHFMTGSEYGSVLRYDAFPEDAIPSVLTLSDENYGLTAEGQFIRLDLADIDDDNFLEMIIGNQRGGLGIFETDFFVGSSSTDVLTESNILFYPNPVSDKLFFEGNEAISYRVYDASGKLLVAKTNTFEAISFADILPGIYLLEVEDQNGKISNRKIVRQ